MIFIRKKEFFPLFLRKYVWALDLEINRIVYPQKWCLIIQKKSCYVNWGFSPQHSRQRRHSRSCLSETWLSTWHLQFTSAWWFVLASDWQVWRGEQWCPKVRTPSVKSPMQEEMSHYLLKLIVHLRSLTDLTANKVIYSPFIVQTFLNWAFCLYQPFLIIKEKQSNLLHCGLFTKTKSTFRWIKTQHQSIS